MRRHALLAVRSGQRVNRSGRGIERDTESTSLRVQRLTVRGGRSRVAIGLRQREVAEGRHLTEEYERVAIVQIHGGELAAVEAQRFPRAAGNASHIGALPGPRVEHDAASTGPRCVPQTQQSGGQLFLRGRGAGIEEPLLVIPLCDRLTGLRLGDALGGAPGVLTE